MKDKIIIVGDGNIGSYTKRLMSEKHDVEYIDVKSYTITINGKTYEKIIGKEMIKIHNLNYGSNYQRQLDPNIDIVKEFGLIELKKSNLSKWEREQVVFKFNKMYKLCQS